MQPIIEPVDPKLISAELGPDKRILTFRGLEVFLFRGADAPQTLREIGRIRETEFRAVGAGRGVDTDIDRHDLDETPCRQLIAWDGERGEIVAAYRFVACRDVLASVEGAAGLRTAGLFDFSPEFSEDYLPYSLELARSVVNRRAGKAYMGLFVVWAGLGALVRELPWLRFFFGNVTLYETCPLEARLLLLAFLDTYHRGPDALVRARPGLAHPRTPDRPFGGSRYEADYEELRRRLQDFGQDVPLILQSYLGASRALLAFDTARDDDFGGAWETAILVPVGGIHEGARRRFIDAYVSTNPAAFRAAADSR